MRFILVNDRKPRKDAYCAWCTGVLTDAYLREVGTRILYHDFACYQDHCNAANTALGVAYEVQKLLPSPRPGVPSAPLVLVGV